MSKREGNMYILYVCKSVIAQDLVDKRTSTAFSPQVSSHSHED